jgi:carbonic anhydrase
MCIVVFKRLREGLVPEARQVLDELVEGNYRFATGQSKYRFYSTEQLEEIAKIQKPIAAIVACSDSRVTPEVIFDQPLGQIFASRVPGAVCSDSAKWMIDIAVGHFEVPLVMVMGHSGCLAVSQVLQGLEGPGGPLRLKVQEAVSRIDRGSDDPLFAAVAENVRQSMDDLIKESSALEKAVQSGKTSVVGSVYDMPTGKIEWVELKVASS